MRDPVTIFIDGIQGKLLTANERFLYFYEWEVLFTLFGVLCTYAIEYLFFGRPYGSPEIWATFVLLVCIVIARSIKKYDTIYHKNTVLVNWIIQTVESIAAQEHVPLPPDGESVERSAVTTARLPIVDPESSSSVLPATSAPDNEPEVK